MVMVSDGIVAGWAPAGRGSGGDWLAAGGALGLRLVPVLRLCVKRLGDFLVERVVRLYADAILLEVVGNRVAVVCNIESLPDFCAESAVGFGVNGNRAIWQPSPNGVAAWLAV